MSFYTALVIIMAIVSITVLGLSAIGTYKELKYERRAADFIDHIERMERNKQKKEGGNNAK
mgnify:CR=1 FL=1